jgi:hypothetical protein
MFFTVFAVHSRHNPKEPSKRNNHAFLFPSITTHQPICG